VTVTIDNKMPRHRLGIAPMTPAESRRIKAGGEAASDCRSRPRGAADDRPAARLRPRLTQEVLDRHDPNHHGHIAELDAVRSEKLTMTCE